MHINVSINKNSNGLQLELSGDLTVGDLKAIIEVETAIAASSQTLIFDHMHLLDDELTLSRINPISINSVSLEVCVNCTRKSEPFPHKSSRQIADDLISQENTAKGGEIRAPVKKVGAFDSAMKKAVDALMSASSIVDDAESQTRILNFIRQRQIDENYRLALDISPESFVAVNLLYIKLKINGHEAFALVDTGAQQTILHPNLAEAFGVSNLVDKRFASDAVGVGTQRSEGKIHSVPVSLGDMRIEVPCSFTILDLHVGILFGLDMLKRHKCCVDLETNSLMIDHKPIIFLTDYEIETVVVPWQVKNRLIHPMKKSTEPPPVEIGKPEPHPARSHDFNEQSTRATYSQASITMLTSLGFSEKEAIAALEQAGGNVELAASSLF